MKGFRIREEMNGVEEPPGKTWFWELEAGVIFADRCIQCGTCVAVCPSNSLGVNAESGLPELVKMCTGCSLCWDFCPRGGLRYEALWPPSSLSADAAEAPVVVKADAADTYWKLTGGPPGDGLGAVTHSYAVRAGARADDAQDGGVVTAMLLALLAGGDIDGALVSKPSTDPNEPWKGIATVATTAKEITAAAGSYYNQTMALAELDLSRYDLPAKPRLAVVGTPCEIQGIRAMQARRWPTGAHRVDAIVLTIALLCTKSFDYEALMLRELRDKRGLDLDRVSKVDVIHGRMIVEYRDGDVAVDEPVKDFHGAALKGCDECADFLGRGADLSIGSVGSMAGWSSVLVRSEAGRLAFERARGRLDVRDLDDPEALLKLDRLDKRVAERTLQRKLDPDAPLFIDFAEHVSLYSGTDRAPVVKER
jgi:coenzyme F420 hydrogenase subunit beta